MRTNIADARQKIELSRAARVIAANLVTNGRGGGRRRPVMGSRPLPTNRQSSFRSPPIEQRIGFRRRGGRFDRGRIGKPPFSGSGMYSDRQQNRKTMSNFRMTTQNRFRNEATSQEVVIDEDDDLLTRTIRNNRITGLNRGLTFSVPARNNRISNNSNRGTFLAALQGIEKSREEMNEVVIKSYNSSVFDRLAPAQSQSANFPKKTAHRVNITNLNPSVTEDDVEELFGSVGSLTGSGLKRPGVAYADFLRLQDAKKAISEFNNRELDGIPMKCLLESDSISKQIPTKAKPAPKKFEIIERDNDVDEPMEVDKDFITQALFNKDDATSSKHAVQFTVKI